MTSKYVSIINENEIFLIEMAIDQQGGIRTSKKLLVNFLFCLYATEITHHRQLISIKLVDLPSSFSYI